ncbi:Auxin-induced in root cultures protein 12 [Dichanthelium oligosanthes]|uniref:Auxin-induced in root cultures protein 12 n=1 Tax=Dichanthelium oligosanthes TaxID=888268 RepID=A0A1E5VIB6_9POAL|nr:Auxin-induced in root cultures protein 12 [Dichanthelium oligosanthes]
MAAAASTMPRSLPLLLVLLLASPAATRLASAATCASEKFPAGRTYATCEDLPKLGASLHWTYDASKSSLSVAFVAAPAASGGWVAWGLNPTGEGMAGAQALVALSGAGAGGAPTVKTYNISGYALGNSTTALEFPATDLAADAGGSGGKIRVYGKLQLRKGMKAVNQVWQVGSSVTGGVPDKHAFGADNLSAKSKLVLTGKTAAAAGAPAVSPAPAPEAGGDSGAASSMAPSAGKNPNAATVAAAGVSAPALLALALVGFLVTV